ncbi:MAG: hypothetical protein DRP56_08515 [Planctomycetota bacterium]|nr:MAG: hypothetical protein DRP56_08515 [Planctomycetota bacterium]
MELIKHKKISLKKHPVLNEAWLQEQIAKDPSILGLGDVDVLDRERIQEAGGRLDILLSDSDTNRRYELELMLGATDPSHIIRCIEYWDVERRRYPAHDHIAVLIAEEVTARFLNVISLMAGNIPIIAIQLDALQVDEKLLLNFVQILNQTALRSDEEDDGGGIEVDRSYWNNRVGQNIMDMCVEILSFINEAAEPKQEMNYKKRHVGLKSNGVVRNFISFSPKKSFLRVAVATPDTNAWLHKLEDEGVPVDINRSGKVRILIKAKDFDGCKDIIRELVQSSVCEFQK